jgi:hypothetical protein
MIPQMKPKYQLDHLHYNDLGHINYANTVEPLHWHWKIMQISVELW